MSLFERIEEFSLQEDSFGLFGLQEDLLSGDLDGAYFLNTNVGQDEGLKVQQPLQTSLESLVMPGTIEDSFGEDWMETVDLSSLLNGNQDLSSLLNGNHQEMPPLIEIPASEPEPELEPRKEGLKASAFELLKQLLTCPVSEPQVESPAPEESLPSLPSSPEQQVVDLHFFTTPEVNVVNIGNLDLLTEAETVSYNCLEDLIEIKQECDESVQEIDTIESIVYDNRDQSWSAPQSVASSDSFSSQPSSPEQFQTIDSSHLGDLSDSYSQVSENDFLETQSSSSSRKTKRESKSRATPYDVGTPVVGDKKVRKKVQNKNAATRYRVKKRNEKQSLQEQESEMSDKNKELREKVESLQREISYMKELMSEIQKAKLKKF